MKIAIIGSGIAGLTTAHLLHRRHEISLFEAQSWIGGHARTLDIELEGARYTVETGFIVFNTHTYPHFTRLLEQLGVGHRPTDMSFSVSDPASGVEYSSHCLDSLFAQRGNLLSPAFWGMVRDILRFNREVLEDLDQQRISDTLTLANYLQLGQYGQRFIDHYIVPMGATIWCMSRADMLNIPLRFFLRFLRSQGLLSINQQPNWRVVEGGASTYVSRLSQGFRQRIRLGCPVHRVERDALGTTLYSAAGAERFDKVVFACHSDQTLRLLANPTPGERAILGALPFASHDLVLHTDTSLLPRRRRAWASWNYRLGGSRERPVAVTYQMNRLQGLPGPHTLCISLNQADTIDPNQVLTRFSYATPQYSLAGIEAQARWRELLGVNHSYFCGAYWGHGFHEDGVVSALRAVEALEGQAAMRTFLHPQANAVDA